MKSTFLLVALCLADATLAGNFPEQPGECPSGARIATSNSHFAGFGGRGYFWACSGGTAYQVDCAGSIIQVGTQGVIPQGVYRVGGGLSCLPQNPGQCLPGDYLATSNVGTVHYARHGYAWLCAPSGWGYQLDCSGAIVVITSAGGLPLRVFDPRGGLSCKE